MNGTHENIEQLIKILGYRNIQEVIDKMISLGIYENDEEVLYLDIQNFLTGVMINKHFKDLI